MNANVVPADAADADRNAASNVVGAETIRPNDAASKGSSPAVEAEIIRHEKVLIDNMRAGRIGTPGVDRQWYGLGLSGGGIRSASLCLGVLQALAEKDLLKRFDYLSSVSGGGYIATSLQWWWHRPREDRPDPNVPTATFGANPDDFPYGGARRSSTNEKAASGLASHGPNAASAGNFSDRQSMRDRSEKNLAFLRAHSSYLTPGNGISLWSILGVLLRTVAISLFTWLPILTLLFIGIIFLNGPINDLARSLALSWPDDAWMPAQWMPGDCRLQLDCAVRYPAVFAFFLFLFVLTAAAFGAAAILFAFVSRAPQDPSDRRATIVKHGCGGTAAAAGTYLIHASYSWLDLTMLLLSVLLAIYAAVAVLIVVSECITTKSLHASYWLRRSIERLMGKAFIPSLALLALSSIPVVPYYAWKTASSPTHITLGAAAALVSGVGSAIYGYYTFLRNIVPGLAGQIGATVGSIVYLYATLVLSYSLALLVIYHSDLPIEWNGWLYQGLVASIVVGVAISMTANVNYVGFHRFYRDRLMEAFMPTDVSIFNLRANFSPIADNLSIAELCASFDTGALASRPSDRKEAPNDVFKPHPYPLINTNAIMVNDDDQKLASRGGDNFIISPLYVGSRATGWQRTAEYIERNGPITLASAMAASGAAANASAGYIGTGITTNPLVSTVMSLLNIRLGLWIGNPFHRTVSAIRSIPTFANAGLFAMLFRSQHRHDSKFIELTDGGHFENLGLYELVRRKLDVIVIVDGEQDPTISLASLVSAARRVEQDFGARLSLVKGKGPERLAMYPAEKSYPAGAKYAEAPYLVGELVYADGTKGTIIYLKATNIRDMDFTTAGYLAGNPDFPHQTTANQFFIPDQFDAYRLLGYESAVQMIEGLKLTSTFMDASAILGEYDAVAERKPV